MKQKPIVRTPVTSAKRSVGRMIFLNVLLVCALDWTNLPANAAIRYFRPDSANNLRWSKPENWTTGFPNYEHAVPQNGDDLVFDNVFVPWDSTNDLVNLTVRSLSFGINDVQLNAEIYIIHGNTIGVSQKISVLWAETEVDIRCGIQLGGTVTFETKYGSGDLTADLDVFGPIDLNGHDLRLDAGYAGPIDLSGVISGNGNIQIPAYNGGGSPSTVKLSGSQGNTFSGSVIVGANRRVEFDKSSGLAVPGPLTIGQNCEVKLKEPHQIWDGATVAIGAGSRFLLEGNTESIAGLSLNGGTVGFDGIVVDTGGATLSVQYDITSYTETFPPTIKGKLGLPPGGHSINVQGPAYYGLAIEAQILGDGGFTKVGPAILLLQGSNIFNGEIQVNEGVLEARHGNALGSVAGFTYLNNNGTLVLNSAAIYGESLFVRGNLALGPDASGSWLEAVGTNVWSGPIILDTNLVVTGYTNSRVNFNGLTSGPSGLRCLSGTVEISGTDANTFTGATLVRNRLLLLNKSSGVAAFNGPLVVGGGSEPWCEVRWLQNYQRVGANVTLTNNAHVNLNNYSDDFGPITFNGGEISTGTGELGIYGLVSVPLEQYGSIDGRIGLPAGYHEFHVEFNPVISAGLDINAAIVGPGHLRKTGLGHLLLGGANTYTGLTIVDEGTLIVTVPAGLGSPSTDTIVNDGGTLRFSPGLATITVPERISIRGNGTAGDGALEIYGNTILRNTFPSIYACLDLTTNANIRIETGAQLTADGFISGVGPLTKTGAGTLVFSNADANTYSSDTIIREGTLELRKPNNVNSVPGNLVLGPAPIGSAATARWFQSGAIKVNSNVTVNANSLLDLNGFDQTLARLNLNDGGDARTDEGRLNIAPGGVVQVGSLSPSGSHASSFISGNLGLPANNFVTFAVAPYAIFPPFAVAPELDVSALISVNGFEAGNLEPAGFSKVSLGWMRLMANNTYKGEAFISDGTLQVEGSQPLSSARVANGGRLQGSGTLGPVFFQGNSGVIAPGASPGILTTSNFNAGASGSGVLHIELNGTTAGSGYDQVNVNGTVTLTGTTLSGWLNFPSAVSNQFTIVENDGTDAVIGTFNGLPQNANFYIGGEQFTINYTGGTGNDVVLTRITTPPKPLLTIEAISPSLVRLLWPANDPAFRLEFTTNLPGASWTAALPLPVIVGTNYVVTNATTGFASSSAATPLAWYRLEENDPGAASGTAVTNTTTDSTSANHLKQFGNPLYTSAVSTDATAQVSSSLAVQLNGSGQYLSNAVVTTALNNFGIEAWVKPNAVSSAYQFVAYNGNTANNGWGIVWQDGVFQGWFGNVILFGAGTATPGTWAHVALVRDNGSSSLYVNGVSTHIPTGFSPLAPSTGFALGVRPQAPVTDFFNGAIDEVRVFTFAPGQFSTNDLLLNRASTETLVPSVRFYRLVKP